MSHSKMIILLRLLLNTAPIVAITASTLLTSSPVFSSEFFSDSKNTYQRDAINVSQPMGQYVGELQERWQFPSDHLPIGMSIEDLNIASWNVLSAEYMSWVIEKNTQGISRSMIADEHVYIKNSKLTIRDQHVVELILQMLKHPSHPKHLIALQESSRPFLIELKKRLPANFAILESHGNAIVFDQSLFEVVNEKSVANIFSNQPTRTVQDVLLRLKTRNEFFRLVNIHLPGDPSQPGRFEFAQYLAQTFDPNLTTIAMGDMNFNELEMADAIQKAFPHTTPPLSLYSPYCTNVSPGTLYSKAIDHFIVDSAIKPILLQPNEVMEGLSPIANLLLDTETLASHL